MKLFQSISAVLMIAFAAIALTLATPSASAGDPQIDAAKAAGIVGERVDGFLDFVTDTSDDSLRRKVNEINTKRRALYEQLARNTGTTLEQVGIVTGQKQIENTPSGQYYMDENGEWVRK